LFFRPHIRSSSLLESLKFYKIYPKRVRKWIEDAKTPIGFYDAQGIWTPTTQPQRPLSLETKLRWAKAKDTPFVKRELKTEKELYSKPLPPDLEGKYRFGVTQEEIDQLKLSPKVLNILTFKNVNPSEIKQFRIAETVKRFGKDPTDTGDSAVQVAVLTEKLRTIVEHLKSNNRDKVTRHHYLLTVNKRLAQMKYLKRTNPEKYWAVIKHYGIPDCDFRAVTGHLIEKGLPGKRHLEREMRLEQWELEQKENQKSKSTKN